ncbi:hypothetical protein ACFVH6_33515 [Spirillospora sp. NPDC127200]
MADSCEILLSAELPPSLSAEEAAELRWLHDRATVFACHKRFYEEEAFTPVHGGGLAP